MGNGSAFASGINNSGQITGYFSPDGDKTTHGFLYSSPYSKLNFTTIDAPGASATLPTGINISGVVSGNFFSAATNTYQTFLFSEGHFNSFYPGPGPAGLLNGNVDISSIAAPFSITSGAGAFTLAKDSTQQIQLSFSPDAKKLFKSMIAVTSSDPMRRKVIVTVTGRGR